MSTKEKIYVSITSWSKRINNVVPVLESILRQTCLPYKIVLNLCTEDFPAMEEDLPDDLVNFLEAHSDIIDVYWFIENYTFWKKHLHTLEIVKDDDLILSIDDDCLYPEDFIEKMYASYVYYGKKYPITSENKWLVYNIWPFTGSGTLYRRSDFPKDYKKYLTEEVLFSAIDDFIILLLFSINKTVIMPCKFNLPYKEDILFDDVFPSTETKDEEKNRNFLNKTYASAENMLKKYYFKDRTPAFTPTYWDVFVSLHEYMKTIKYPFPEMEFSISAFKANWLNPNGIKSYDIKKKLHLDIELCK